MPEPIVIRLTSNDLPLDPSFLDRPGGYAWWYVDVVDDEGNGIVVIWSFGLPFLPGWTSSARRGKAGACRTTPSLNVVLYERGQPAFYHLQRYEAHDASASVDGSAWRFGRSTMHTERSEDGGRLALHLHLDMDVPHSPPLTGTVLVHGRTRTPSSGERPSDGLSHEWCPLVGAASGHVDLRFDHRPFRMVGDAYHDRNGSPVHIDGLGIHRWTWGRARLPGRTAIWYLLWPTAPSDPPRCLGVEIDDDGTTRTLEPLEVRTGRARRDRYGMCWWPTLELRHEGAPWLTTTHTHMVDRGPFYLREQVEVTDPSGEVARGWSEYVEPSRVDLARHRPLVRMRVDDLTRRRSFWLPLFVGSTNDRVRRLITRRPISADRALPLHADVPPELRAVIRRATREG